MLNLIFKSCLYLIPVLALIKFFMKKYFPNLVNLIMKKVHSHLISLKSNHFQEAFNKVNTNNKTGRLEILELGIGTGENFRFFPKNSNITILDKTDIFLPFLEKSIETNDRKDLSVSKLVINKAEDMNSIQSNSMDAVVHTFILCSVDDYIKVMSEIKRVLKPGGVCVFIEHSIDNENFLRKCLQKVLEIFTGDCKFLDMRKVLCSGVYDKVTLSKHTITSKIVNFINPMVYGYAQKF